MSDYVTLLGAEDVRNAAHSMRESAEIIKTVANNLDFSLQQFKAWADEWLARFIDAVERRSSNG